MHLFQAQPANQIALAGRAASSGRLTAFFAALLGRGIRANPDVVPNYEGCAWSDSLESQVNSDLATCRRGRF